MRGIVPATSPSNKSRGQVPSCELAIFATKSSRRDQNLVPATSPTNSNWFELVGQVPATSPSKPFVGTHDGTCPCDQSLRVNSLRDKSQGLVPSCVPTFIVNLLAVVLFYTGYDEVDIDIEIGINTDTIPMAFVSLL